MKIHYSELDLFLQCPNAYKRRYVLKVPDTEKSSALEYGSALHLALKGHFEGEDPQELFTMYWDSLKNTEMKYYRHDWQQLRDLATNSFIRNFVRLHSNKFANVKMEELCEAPLFDGITLEGTFDMCSDYDGVLTMTDWKTSGSVYKEDKILKNPQLWIYAYMYKNKYGVLPKQIMYKTFVKYNGSIQTLKTELTEEKLSLQMKNVADIIKLMLYAKEKDIFPHSFNCYCKE